MIDEEVVRKFVYKLVMGKMQNRQFADAEMTMAEFTMVCETLCHSLLGKYHRRPKYSEVDAEDGRNEQNTAQEKPQGIPVEKTAQPTAGTAPERKAQDTAASAASQGTIDIHEPSVKDGEWRQDGVK